MSVTIHHTNCPACGSAELSNVFKVRDHTVSGELFLVIECRNCLLRFTQDIPAPEQIGRYYKSENYISHSNNAQGIINRIYYKVRKRTLVRKRKLIQSVTGKASGSLLDIGSGTGLFAAEMKSNNWKVTGLEPDEDARAVARTSTLVELENMDRFYQLPAGSYDAITMWHVMEHVHDLQGYMVKLKELLAENGRLFIAVPNYTSLDASVYKENWAAYDVPRHLYHFSPTSMQQLVKLHGMRIESYKPMWYDSFYISLVSSKYKNGKTNWIGAAWTGFRSNLRTLFNPRACSSVIYIISK